MFFFALFDRPLNRITQSIDQSTMFARYSYAIQLQCVSIWVLFVAAVIVIVNNSFVFFLSFLLFASLIFWIFLLLLHNVYVCVCVLMFVFVLHLFTFGTKTKNEITIQQTSPHYSRIISTIMLNEMSIDQINFGIFFCFVFNYFWALDMFV